MNGNIRMINKLAHRVVRNFRAFSCAWSLINLNYYLSQMPALTEKLYQFWNFIKSVGAINNRF